MKKRFLLLLCAVFAMMQINAQQIVEATKSGFVKKGSTSFTETVLEVKAKTITYSRVSYVEVPVSGVDITQVKLHVYYYNSNTAGDWPVDFKTMAGGLPVDGDGNVTLNFDNQEPDASFADAATVQTNNTAYGWVEVDITTAYNAALTAGESALTIRMSSRDENAALIKFYSLGTGTGNKPYISVLSNCLPEYNTIEKTLVEGTSIVIDGETVTTSGTYEEVSTTACGAEKIDTYHVLFIADGTVNNNVAICDGDSYEVQVGPNTFKNYDTAGPHTDVITSDDASATQTINTTITVNPLPAAPFLGDDFTIREGESATLNAGSSFNAYQWYNNSVAISGETNSTLTVSSMNDAFTFGTNEVHVAVTDGNGCTGGTNDDAIWVDIVGNYVAPEKDMYLEEAGDRLLDIARLEVKYDTWGDQNNDVAGAPYYTKEIHLAFDLTGAGIPQNATNYKLKLYMYSLAGNPKQPTDNPSININCDYADGLYGDDMIWSTRTAMVDRTPLAAAVTVTESMINSIVEWDINDIFVNDILGTKNQFTVILSTPNDAYSILAKFRDLTNANVDVRPSISFDVPTAIGDDTKEVEVNLAPNPVTTDLFINSDEQFTSAQVYNMLGQVVISTPVNNDRISMANLPKGQYIVSLINDKQKVSKIIIKK
ncbi:DNRLRE domain-containing protein [Carboxylicivirga marina]|uniref:T9SS type A sorting domain-containing protein n=1 Tax=Carboxylicivirga marina TaxID=2800988 RepID=A0ABS1HMW8_9BACT|nr:DNRLRE domain-containing protein [Carboxylicivirga marina]MBK3519012.1 T9SS type A sorting domain-containing protein [Carboxylicivirga marina]